MNKDRLNSKLAKITKDHLEVLNLAKQELLNVDILTDLNKIVFELSFKENSKKYLPILKSKNIINKIIEDIAKTNDIEEINKLRRKLNYYLNKIKNELAQRENIMDYYISYENDVNNLRNSISNYTKVLKRENNLNRIKKSLKGRLTKTTIANIKKSLKNENQFNKRFLSKKQTKKEVIKEEKVLVTEETKPIITKKEKRSLLKMFMDDLKGLKRKLDDTSIPRSFKKSILTYGLAISLVAASSKPTTVLANTKNMIESFENNEFDEDLLIISQTDLDNQDINNIMAKTYDKVYTNNPEYQKHVDLYNNADNTEELEQKKKFVANAIKYEKMSHDIRKNYTLTKEQLNTLIELFTDEENESYISCNKIDVIDYLYNAKNLNYHEKMLVVMARESLSYDELDMICAGMVAEAGNYYEEAYRTTSVLYNRVHSVRWASEFGTNLYDQFTAPSQFSVYSLKKYEQYLGARELEAYQAAVDMLYYRVPCIKHLGFRSSDFELDCTFDQFACNGNKFINPMKDSDFIESEYIDVIEEELENDSIEDEKQLMLELYK